jgi:hypothetical protein
MVAEERLKVTFIDIAQQGAAFARHNDEAVFADYGIPGEEAFVEVRRGRLSVAAYRLSLSIDLEKVDGRGLWHPGPALRSSVSH